jgi:uncharacterized protein YjbI with pentapeptide repeats
MKQIKFDLRLKGVLMTNFDELQDNFSADILPLFQSGKLARWFKSREMPEQVLAVEAIDKNGSELQQLKGICQILELDADEEVLQYLLDDRQVPQAAPSAPAAEVSEDEIEGSSIQSTSSIDWSGKNMSGRSFIGEDLRNANLKGTNFSGADLSKADLTGADLSGANLKGANLTAAILKSANLSGANMKATLLCDANLSNANLTNAALNFAKTTHQNRLSGGYQKLRCVNFSKADLTDAKLKNSRLDCADFSEANLTRVSLVDASLYGANFTNADLSFADMTKLSFASSGQYDEKMRRVSGSKFTLTGAKLTGVTGFKQS